MLASELIQELQKQIDSVGDKEVYYWNDVESNFYLILSTYSTVGACDGIIVTSEDD